MDPTSPAFRLLALASASAALIAFTPRAEAAAPLSVGRVSRVELIQLGASRNLDLLSKRLETVRLEALQRGAWQAYNPSLILDSDFSRYAAPGDGRDKVLGYSAGVAWRAPIGTALSATVDMNQSLAGPIAPSNDGALVLGLTQPLLKDGWLEGAALPLSEARLQAAIQREVFKHDLNNFIVELETAYWDLAVAEADLTIKNRSRDRAKQQYDDTAENIRRGILAEVEIYVVEDNVVFFEQEHLRAEQNLRNARRKLAELTLLDADSPLHAADGLAKPALELPPRQRAIDEGMRSNPRLLEQRLRAELSAARHAHAFNQALPALGLNASLALRGQHDVYRDAWGTIFAPASPDARVGLLLAVPLDRDPVRAAVEAARIDTERQHVELQSREVKVRFEIDNALSDLDSNLKLSALAQKQVAVAELKLAAETDKYKNGISTLADVVRFQRDLDNALIAFQRNIRTIHVNRARLLASQGILFQTVGVGLR